MKKKMLASEVGEVGEALRNVSWQFWNETSEKKQRLLCELGRQNGFKIVKQPLAKDMCQCILSVDGAFGSRKIISKRN